MRSNNVAAVIAALLVLGLVLWLPAVRGPLMALGRAARGMIAAAWRRRRALAVIARVDPPLAKEFEKLEAAKIDDEPLVTRYCLVDKNGRKLEVEGMPGHVALYTTYSKANGRRRRGETVHKIRVKAAALAPTLRRGLVSVLLVALLIAAACGSPLGLVAEGDEPPAPPPPPGLTLCRRILADTLWIDGVPHVEYLTVCGAP